MNKKGILIVVSGFSGAGKGTLMKELMRKYPENYALSISATTRGPRDGEVDGREYFFLSREKFEKMIANNELIEYTWKTIMAHRVHMLRRCWMKGKM